MLLSKCYAWRCVPAKYPFSRCPTAKIPLILLLVGADQTNWLMVQLLCASAKYAYVLVFRHLQYTGSVLHVDHHA